MEKRSRALEDDDEPVVAAPAAAAEPVLRFRNYKPRDERLPHAKIEPVRPPKPAAAEPVDTASLAVDPLLNLVPKKPNWDLERDIEKDLAKLDRQTELAIMELLRRKITEADNSGGEALDLAAAVREQERMESKADDDE
ncbi:cwf18 pre-mRNA splicing factor-domain-containing protein [Pavlovales sp. CCMP2436]|nr:cwf18 pre-mRNA splicing factor-domain-containing protein [Pavlovales sp. CCMP2436]